MTTHTEARVFMIGRKLKSERWYCRVYRDAEGTERTVKLDPDKGRAGVRERGPTGGPQEAA